MTAVASHYARSAEDWAIDATTTTMGERPRYALNTRTTEPVRHDSARPRAVRLTGDRARYVAWAQIRELRDVLRYDLELAVADEVMLGETEWVASITPPEHGFQLVFVYGAGEEAARQPRTELGKRLMELRRNIIASGAPLLDWEGLEHEVRLRRGGVYPEGPA